VAAQTTSPYAAMRAVPRHARKLQAAANWILHARPHVRPQLRPGATEWANRRGQITEYVPMEARNSRRDRTNKDIMLARGRTALATSQELSGSDN
jgi:hypothetical protein